MSDAIEALTKSIKADVEKLGMLRRVEELVPSTPPDGAVYAVIKVRAFGAFTYVAYLDATTAGVWHLSRNGAAAVRGVRWEEILNRTLRNPDVTPVSIRVWTNSGIGEEVRFDGS